MDTITARKASIERLRSTGLTLEQIARQMHVSRPTIANWLRGVDSIPCPDCGEPMIVPAPRCGFCVGERQEAVA